MADFRVHDHGTMWSLVALHGNAADRLTDGGDEREDSIIGDWRPMWHFCQQLHDEGYTFETNTETSKNLIETGRPW